MDRQDKHLKSAFLSLELIRDATYTLESSKLQVKTAISKLIKRNALYTAFQARFKLKLAIAITYSSF